MRRGLVQTGVWAVATGAAVALSWLGVNTALSQAAFEAPLTLPLPAAPSAAASLPAAAPGTVMTPDRTTADGTALGGAESSQRPAQPSTASAPASRSTPARHQVGPTAAAPSTASTVQSYLLPGGRVALDIHPDHADLVSATPDSGWQMQIWNGDQWMRIDFQQQPGGGRVSSVFVTWNGHPPDVQTVPG